MRRDHCGGPWKTAVLESAATRATVPTYSSPSPLTDWQGTYWDIACESLASRLPGARVSQGKWIYIKESLHPAPVLFSASCRNSSWEGESPAVQPPSPSEMYEKRPPLQPCGPWFPVFTVPTMLPIFGAGAWTLLISPVMLFFVFCFLSVHDINNSPSKLHRPSDSSGHYSWMSIWDLPVSGLWICKTDCLSGACLWD